MAHRPGRHTTHIVLGGISMCGTKVLLHSHSQTILHAHLYLPSVDAARVRHTRLDGGGGGSCDDGVIRGRAEARKRAFSPAAPDNAARLQKQNKTIRTKAESFKTKENFSSDKATSKQKAIGM